VDIYQTLIVTWASLFGQLVSSSQTSRLMSAWSPGEKLRGGRR
jgi:hypothetical protein